MHYTTDPLHCHIILDALTGLSSGATVIINSFKCYTAHRQTESLTNYTEREVHYKLKQTSCNWQQGMQLGQLNCLLQNLYTSQILHPANRTICLAPCYLQRFDTDNTLLHVQTHQPTLEAKECQQIVTMLKLQPLPLVAVCTRQQPWRDLSHRALA